MLNGRGNGLYQLFFVLPTFRHVKYANLPIRLFISRVMRLSPECNERKAVSFSEISIRSSGG